MTFLWFGAIGFYGLASVWLLFRNAVEGYEDGTGFHYAIPPAKLRSMRGATRQIHRRPIDRAPAREASRL